MYFKTETNEKIRLNTDGFTRIGSGYFGTVYRKDDMCLKLFSRNPLHDTYEVLKTIRGIDSPYLYKIYDFYFDNDSLDLTAYTMKFYEFIRDNILTMGPEFLQESVNGLYKLADELAKKGIYMYDVYEDNALITKNGIVLIDCDNYKIDKKDIGYNSFNNYLEINKLMIKLMLEQLDLLSRCDIFNYNRYDSREKINDLIYGSKIFELKEKPIDFILRK